MRRKFILAVCLLTVAAPAIAAEQLTGADYEYLNSIGQTKEFMDDMNLSSAWKAKVHQTINDPRTKSDKKTRQEAVGKILDLFVATSLLCTTPDYRKKEPQQCQSLYGNRQ